jgi:exopolyphosphatase/guanosine-5'-triphosphate,3'-diphosphate pyrophosphatase
VRVGEGIEVLDDSSHVTRLAQGFAAAERQGAAESWMLTAEAVDDTVSVVREIQRKARSLGVTDFRAVATWALRTGEGGASDAQALLSRLAEETGLRVELLSSEDECRMAFAGATSSIPLPEGPCLTLDLGGGTLNIAWGTVAVGALPAEVTGFAALPLGARAMTRAFFQHDPPLVGEVEALCRRVMEVLTPPAVRRVPSETAAVGCGGGFTTLAALNALRKQPGVSGAYDRSLVHGSVLSQGDLARLAEELTGKTLAERARLPGVGAERADIIAAAAAVARQSALLLRLREVIVSDDGLLWGYVVTRLGDRN